MSLPLRKIAMSCPSRLLLQSGRSYHASSTLRRQDLYHDLGLTRNATQDEIKRAYRELALKLHPDVSQEDTSEQFSRVTTAYEILSDARSREQYDSESRVGGFRSDHFMKNMHKPRETAYSPAGYAAAARNKNKTVNPSHFNMKEWEEWHYGNDADKTPSVATKNWMKMQQNAHQDYFRKKMSRKVVKEREEGAHRYNYGRNDDDEEDRFYERGGPVSASVASENLRRQREARRERGGASEAEGCVIS